MEDATLTRLQKWYLDQCDGEWEHSWGLDIGTLDNPGWSLKVSLKGTPAEQMPFDPITVQREDETDWVHCKVDGDQFLGHCGPNNLNQLLEVFLDWVESA